MLESLIILQAYLILLRFQPILLVRRMEERKRCLMLHSPKRYFSVHQRIQTDTGIHQASHSMDIDGFFAGNKAAGDVRLTTNSTKCRSSEMMEVYLNCITDLHCMVFISFRNKRTFP
jgi:hypothetical protein